MQNKKIYYTTKKLQRFYVEDAIVFTPDEAPLWAADVSITQSNPVWFAESAASSFLYAICEETNEEWELTFTKEGAILSKK